MVKKQNDIVSSLPVEAVNMRLILTAMTLAAGLFTAVVTGYFSYKSDKIKEQTSQIQLLLKQTADNYTALRFEFTELKKQIKLKDETISDITQKNLELLIKLTDTEIKFALVQAELDKNIDVYDLVQILVDSIPSPAWAKQQDPTTGRFKMIAINEQYTVVYGKTKKEYVGFTDFDNYPYEIALGYEKADLEALNRNYSISVKEVNSRNDKKAIETSVKFKVEFPNNKIFVAGFVITSKFIVIE